MFQDITVDELLELHRKGNIALIDVRSPSEYSDSTIPGSLNIPIFNDEERAEIGTLYKQVSVEAAKDKGLEIVSAKLPSFVKAIEAAGPGRKAVFCWRGGMRSRTSATLASLMGMRMYRLNGGYRAYRKWVVETIERLTELPHCYVINGYTGSGKTELLDKLAQRGYPVINLERMAQHRGSIFGQIGLEPNNQKSFDSLLVQELIRFADSPYLILEAESRRIGKVVVPEPVIIAKEKGTSLFIEMPAAERARNIVREYRPEEHKQACLDSFERIEKRIHTPVAAAIRSALEEDRFEEAVELMLVHYYDPRYQFASDRYGQGHVTIRHDAEHSVLEQVIAQLPPPVFPAKVSV